MRSAENEDDASNDPLDSIGLPETHCSTTKDEAHAGRGSTCERGGRCSCSGSSSWECKDCNNSSQTPRWIRKNTPSSSKEDESKRKKEDKDGCHDESSNYDIFARLVMATTVEPDDA